jgi:hypothetical protein
MIVRCGACRTEFDAPGEGRHACPTCGAINQVSAAPPAAGQAPPPSSGPLTPTGVPGAAPPAPAETAPLTRVTCDECSFEFVVGDIEVASCPNCTAEVTL